ncbi:hypothetical protein NPJ88_000155 [Halomonas elongata]|uniref:secretion/conjugation apparatus DotM-related subunit n=1 Tax=Halomonas elongata TaxID=2746 RepID=UPI00255AEA02|nr:hypothetical protein [Halomonas elongata]MDL4860734.1 hypothetical protein [Halomonas elongata]
MPSNYGERKNDDAALYGVMALIVAVLIYAFWYFFHTTIIYYTLKFAWTLLGFLSIGPMEAVFMPIRQELASAAMYADRIPFIEFLRLSAMGYIAFSPIAIIWIFFEFISTFHNPKEKTKRAMSLDRLRRIMNSHSTATMPLNGYPNLLEADPAEHRSSLSPLEFAKEHNLIHRRILDKQGAEKAFAKQLGDKIASIEDLRPHERAMFAIFAPRIFGKEREQSQHLLDKLNRSAKKTGYPDFSIIEDDFQKYAKNHDVSTWIGHHKYKPTLLYAMHREALQYGKLPSSYFRWLKGTDRVLWYTLNNSGRKVGWSECGGVFSQAEWEIFAKMKHGTLEGVHVTPAVDALEQWLVNAGAIIKPISEGES